MDSAADVTAPTGRRFWLAGFRRITSSGEYIPEIDGIRFVAIAMVVVYHVLVFVAVAQDRLRMGPDLKAWHTTARGVEMFFVLSGFVLALPFAARWLRPAESKPVRLRHYYLRRITRLEPPYLIALLIYTVLKVVTTPQWWPAIIWNTLYSTFYLHCAIQGEQSVAMSVAWSLEVEVQFYLLMPLLAFVFAVRPTWLRRAILVAAMIVIASVQPIAFHAVAMPNTRHLLNALQYFLAGLLLADVWLCEWRGAAPPMRRAAWAWADVASLIAFVGILAIGTLRHEWIDRFALAPLIFIAYLAMFQSGWVRRFMRVPVVTVIGGMCYSIYLLHNLVIQLAGALWRPFLPNGFVIASLLSMLVLSPVVLIACAAYFRLIERPCMRRDWPKKLWIWFERLLFVEVETSDERPEDGATAPSAGEATPTETASAAAPRVS